MSGHAKNSHSSGFRRAVANLIGLGLAMSHAESACQGAIILVSRIMTANSVVPANAGGD